MLHHPKNKPAPYTHSHHRRQTIDLGSTRFSFIFFLLINIPTSPQILYIPHPIIRHLHHTQLNQPSISSLSLPYYFISFFHKIPCNIIYNIIRDMIYHFTEVDIEILLLMFIHCRYPLRCDDHVTLNILYYSDKTYILLK